MHYVKLNLIISNKPKPLIDKIISTQINKTY